MNIPDVILKHTNAYKPLICSQSNSTVLEKIYWYCMTQFITKSNIVIWIVHLSKLYKLQKYEDVCHNNEVTSFVEHGVGECDLKHFSDEMQHVAMVCASLQGLSSGCRIL